MWDQELTSDCVEMTTSSWEELCLTQWPGTHCVNNNSVWFDQNMKDTYFSLYIDKINIKTKTLLKLVIKIY